MIIYDKTSNLELVNVPQKHPFCQNIEQWNQFHQHKMLCYIQPSKQVAYLSGIWTTSNTSQQELPSTEGYGWQLNEQCKWSPVWISLPVAAKACNELVKRGCKSSMGLWRKMHLCTYARRHNGNVLNYVAATVKSINLCDILIMQMF